MYRPAQSRTSGDGDSRHPHTERVRHTARRFPSRARRRLRALSVLCLAAVGCVLDRRPASGQQPVLQRTRRSGGGSADARPRFRQGPARDAADLVIHIHARVDQRLDTNAIVHEEYWRRDVEECLAMVDDAGRRCCWISSTPARTRSPGVGGPREASMASSTTSSGWKRPSTRPSRASSSGFHYASSLNVAFQIAGTGHPSGATTTAATSVLPSMSSCQSCKDGGSYEYHASVGSNCCRVDDVDRRSRTSSSTNDRLGTSVRHRRSRCRARSGCR